jgi:hypothetical protein
LAAVAIGNLAWEFAQMPHYTLWRTGSPGEIAFAVLHCTVGDVVIAASLFWACLDRPRGPVAAHGNEGRVPG